MSLYVCLLYSYVDKPKFKWKSVELGDQLDACVYYLSHSNLQVRQKQCTIQSLSLVQVCTIHIRRYYKSRLYYPRPLIPGGNSKPNARSPHGGRTPVYHDWLRFFSRWWWSQYIPKHLNLHKFLTQNLAKDCEEPAPVFYWSRTLILWWFWKLWPMTRIVKYFRKNLKLWPPFCTTILYSRKSKLISWILSST